MTPKIGDQIKWAGQEWTVQGFFDQDYFGLTMQLSRSGQEWYYALPVSVYLRAKNRGQK